MASSRSRSESADAVIVGGGVIGLACGWRAAQRGLEVTLIERERPGAGASDVAAGMLAPVGEASYGEDRLLELALESHRLWPEFADELAAATASETGYLELGALHVALDGDEAARAAAAVRAHAARTVSRPNGCRRAPVASSSPGSAPAATAACTRRTRPPSIRGR